MGDITWSEYDGTCGDAVYILVWVVVRQACTDVIFHLIFVHLTLYKIHFNEKDEKVKNKNMKIRL